MIHVALGSLNPKTACGRLFHHLAKEEPDYTWVPREQFKNATCPDCRAFFCVHTNIHPGRVDGAITVCRDCQRVVAVSVMKYTNGKTIEQDYKDTLKKLEADE